MKKCIKKLVSIALCLCVVFSTIGIVALAETIPYQEIYLDTPVRVTVTNENPSSYFYFIPEESGMYSFSSSGDGQGYGYILDENHRTLASGGYNYNNSNFKVCAELTAGQKYVLKSTVYSSRDSLYTVIVEKSNIESIVFDDITITDWNGKICYEYNFETGENDLEWTRYDYYNKASGTITYTDGTTENIEKGYFIDGLYQNINYTCNQSYYSQWTVGNSYEVTATLYGITTTFMVYVTEAPKVESITVAPISIMEYTHGSDYGDYFYYDLYAGDTTVTVTLEDGTVLCNKDEWGDSCSFIYYGDESFQIDISLDQSAENPLLPGNTYNATVSVLGATGTFPVTILEAPKAVSVTAEPITIMEGKNGSDYGDYYHYYVEAHDTLVTVTLEDGTVLSNETEWGSLISSVNYNGESFYIDISLDQSAENPLLPGNTYYATVSVLGATCTLPVTILAKPKAVSVTAEPITIVEGTNGSDYGDYYHYYVEAHDTLVTVTLDDGTVLTNESEWGGLNSYINYYGESFDIDFSINQSAENPLLPGNTYDATISILGATCTVPVTISESPVVSIEVLECKPVYTNDYWQSSNGSPIYDTPDFNLKVNFENGDYILLSCGVWSSSGVSCLDNQDKTPWTIGGENIVTVSYMGATTQFNVELIERIFEYKVQDGVAYITDCNSDAENLEIPSEIDGYPVKGILSLGWGLDAVKEISIPDSVTYFSASATYSLENVEVINLGSGIEEVSYWHFYGLQMLKEINVSSSNKNYASVDGVLFNKNSDTLIFYPLAKGDTYSVPSSVIDFSVLYDDIYSSLNINFEAGSDAFLTEDGITYTKDKKIVLSCNPEKTGEYVMPETVTSIAKGAFSNSSLSKITVSSKVTEIVYNTFEYTSNLETVVLPSNLKRIEPYAFYASGISSITLPNGLEEIGESAFEAASLDKIEIPGSVKNISHWAFYSTAPSEIIINEGVESIGYYVFSNSGNNVEAGQLVVHLPNTLKTIGDGAFYDRHDLAEITIPASVTDIGYEAFAKCEGLKTVNLLGSGITLDKCVFKNSPIENFDFDKVSGKIWQQTFENSNLTSVVFPETVTEISYGAFENSKYLEEVDFPETIITLDPDAFEGTPWYENVYNELDDGWVIYDNIFLGYKGDFSKIKDTAPILPEGVTSIVSDSMQYASFSSITLPKSLRVIGIGAFQYNENLSSIYIPENVEFIADTAFCGCTSLTDIKVAENNPYYTVKDGVLYNKDMTELIFCSKQESGVFRVPSTVKKIAYSAFYTSGVNCIIFENTDVEFKQFWDSNSISVKKVIDGLEINSLPTLIFDKSANSKLSTFAQKQMLHTIDINDISANSIELAGTPKTTFNIGDKFIQDDLKLKVNYTDFSEIIDITPEMISGFDSSTVGVKEITVSYNGLFTTYEVIVKGNATISNIVTRPGETFELFVSLDLPINTKSICIDNLQYDKTKITLVSGEWLLADTVLKDWDNANEMGVANFENNKVLNGTLLKLTFTSNETVEEADINISCDVSIKQLHNNKDIDIPVIVKSGKLSIKNVLPGDVNGDSEVNDRDAVYLLYYTFRPDKYPVNQNCDFNNDGEVNDRDAVYLLYYTFRPDKYPIN